MLLAPNGKPSNLSHEQYRLVRTPEFKAWFGDWEKLENIKVKDPAMDEITLQNLSKNVSKVVDQNGEPLFIYGSFVNIDGKLFNIDENMKNIGKRGSITYGASHDEGGIPVKVKSTGEMVEVEGGEGIVNKHSMASGKKVKLNGKEMSLCEAVSAINQMEGNGVKFNCDDVKDAQFIEKMSLGGELEKGIRTEKEHMKVLNDLYNRHITPNEAVEKISIDHISENPFYYTELSEIEKAKKGTIVKRKTYINNDCGCSLHRKRFDSGGIFGMDSFEDLVRKSNPKETILDQKKDIIDETLRTARKAIDYDFKPEIYQNIDSSLRIYFEPFKNLNLYNLGWRFSFGSSRQWAGLCSVEEHEKTMNKQSKNRNLYLSINFVHSDKNWSNNMLDTIYHEIAHAIVFEVFYFKNMSNELNQIDPANETTQGHGKIWKMICDIINPKGNCNQFYQNAILAETFREYFYECAFCDNKYYGNRKNFATNCNQCYKPIIVEKNRI